MAGIQTNDPLGDFTNPDFGLRPDKTKKGSGFLGILNRPDGGVSTEISVGLDFGQGEMDIPTLVPGLEQGEIDFLLNMDPKNPGEIPRSILDKAVNNARDRIGKGLSVFSD